MKWVVDKIGVEQVWYSGDVIEKIKKIALEACLCCGECKTEFSQKSYCDWNEILELINSEDKECTKQN